MGIRFGLSFLLTILFVGQTSACSLPHIVVKVETEKLSQVHSHDHIPHQHSTELKPSDDVASKIYRHKHHSKDKEHSHDKDSLHPPIGSCAQDVPLRQLAFTFALPKIQESVSAITKTNLPDDPFFGRLFRPPIA